MRLYTEVARRTFRRMTTYRSAAAAGIFTNTVFGFLIAYVLLAVYRERPEVGGFDAVDAVTYTFVAQGLLMAVGMFGDWEMAERIRTGDVVADLYRPASYQGWWAGVFFGKAAFYAVFRGIPPFVVGALVFDLRLPPPDAWPWFGASVVAAVAVAFGWRFLVGLSAFWLLDERGPLALATLVALFFSGMYVPLVFFPAWLEAVARALPFAAMIQTPVEVFLGKRPGSEAAWAVGGQAVWAGVLLVLGAMVQARAARRLVVQGG